MRKLYLPLSLLLLSILVLAEGTRTWEQSKFDDFEKGTAKGVAMRSEGGLELAPSLKPIYTTPSTYVWAIAGDAQGNVFAAAGAPARVYRVTPDGQASIIFQPQELQVQALVVDASGAIYAATSPDGKVYKIVRCAAKSAKETPKPTQPPRGSKQRSFRWTRTSRPRSSSIPRPNTSGTWPWTPRASSMSPPATRGRFSGWRKRATFGVF